jgi:hypothetical protein
VEAIVGEIHAFLDCARPAQSEVCLQGETQAVQPGKADEYPDAKYVVVKRLAG